MQSIKSKALLIDIHMENSYQKRGHFIHCARNYEILMAVLIVCLICLRSSGNDFPSSPLLARKWLEGSRWAPRSACSQPLSFAASISCLLTVHKENSKDSFPLSLFPSFALLFSIFIVNRNR